MITALIEVTLWFALFKSSGKSEINGFGLGAYLSYAVWAAFTSRITSTWMYEFRMIEEIESGSINSLLVRPLSFFEYYLSQFMGYKAITTGFSILVPLVVCAFMDLSLIWVRVVPALGLVTYYLLLVQTLSFIIATTAFQLNRVQSFTVAKNLGLWLLSGELVPLDLFPPGIRDILLWSPFANAVYIPVGFVTGRIGVDIFLQGWLTATLGLVVLGSIAAVSWRSGIAKYAGTGA